jgi:steroid delta-isomerase-like uncharacterized protein
MSTDQNKSLVRRYQEAHNSGNLSALDEIVTADLTSHALAPGVPPGLEGGKMIHQAMVGAFPDMQFDIDELIAEGDKVVARFTASGTHRGDLAGLAPTGKHFRISGISVFRIADGKIVEHWAHQGDLGFYQQLGIAPPPG